MNSPASIQTACAAQPCAHNGIILHSKSRCQWAISPLDHFDRFLMALIFLSSAAPSGRPFIPQGSTAIVLAGLPGDLESETLFRDQLRIGARFSTPVDAFAN